MNAEELKKLAIEQREAARLKAEREEQAYRERCEQQRNAGMREAPKTLKVIQERLVRDPLAGKLEHRIHRDAAGYGADIMWMNAHLSTVKIELEKDGYKVETAKEGRWSNKYDRDGVPEPGEYCGTDGKLIIEWETE